MSLIDKLVRTAEIWARENDRSLARLATIVVNDGKLFERLAGGGSCTVATYERLMAHLRDATNWSKPIPCEAAGLLGISVEGQDSVHDGIDTVGCRSASPDSSRRNIGQVAA